MWFARDTGRVPYDTITASSRSTVMMGQGRCFGMPGTYAGGCVHWPPKRAASMKKVSWQSDGLIHVCEDRFTYQQTVENYFGPGMGEVIGHGSYRGKRDPDHPLGGPAAFWEFIVTAVELSVDPGKRAIRPCTG